ncbi:uncharacterized protein LOC118434958 [Folsomia candida]|uniref:Uncharacterized protein n=1 Tax=Folsomia candida TaxID=158441 RepID=A0A226EGM4_FOLCA|nr:uncharacterized protein LOC118434958 [Folsomia candida]OXA56813.1 hypothetical protein Fcan01_08499 [Folsomia candida]
MINPCCWCSAEAGVYILLFFNLLYFVVCVIFGVIFSSWTITVALEDTYPLGYRAVNTVVWIAFVIFFAMETFLGSHLLTAVNRSDNPQEFRQWIRLRIVLLLFICPIIGLFAYLHFSVLTISILIVITIYEFYYIWVVYYYSLELDILLETDSMGIGDDKT